MRNNRIIVKLKERKLMEILLIHTHLLFTTHEWVYIKLDAVTNSSNKLTALVNKLTKVCY